MTAYRIDPLRDPRWSAFIDRHPAASVFHSPGWLNALHRTYGYEPFVLTTSSPDEALTNGLPMCEVAGLLGRRLVSLPFSDHCDPLVDRLADLAELARAIGEGVAAGRWAAVELRPLRAVGPVLEGLPGFRASQHFTYHAADLSAPVETLFARLHASCIRRAIRRAAREELVYEVGSSPDLVARFYRLLCMTRHRHKVLPPPRAWFLNLSAAMGDRLSVRLASKDGRPVAAVMTLSFRRTMVYKYGGSDPSLHRLGGMPALFWLVMQDAKARGFSELDLGRSDMKQAGLITFKDRLGGASSQLTYYRHVASRSQVALSDGWPSRTARRLLAHLPDSAQAVAGRFLYRHFG